ECIGQLHMPSYSITSYAPTLDFLTGTGGALARGAGFFSSTVLATGTGAGAAAFLLFCWIGETRFDNFRRCALPITALRVRPPPRALAISAADLPSPHSFFRTAIRSSVQLIFSPQPLIRARHLFNATFAIIRSG